MKQKLTLATIAFLVVALHVGIARADGGSGGGHGDTELRGAIESLPGSGLVGDWIVSGTTVHVSASTELEEEDGPFEIGAFVKVRGDSLSDGSIDADEIETEHNSGGGDDNGGGSGGDDGGNDGPGGGGSGGDDGGGHHGGDDDGNDDEIHGIIESLPASGLVGDWVVSGRTVHVFATTSIEQEHGQAVVGAGVEVHGAPQSDGSLNATRIEVNPTNGGNPTGGEAKFFGTVESLPSGSLLGTWVVSGRTVRVDASTVVEREHNVAPAVGSYVEVEGRQLEDGSVQARKVEVKTGGSSQQPGDDNPSSRGSGYVEIRARVDALPSNGFVGEWTVGGQMVFVTDSTQIKQKRNRPIEVGSTVEVRGNQRMDGSIDANRVEAKSSTGGGRRARSSFYGTIESLPSNGFVGEWVVGARTVTVTASTVVDEEHGRASVGALVEVKATSGADGAIVATRIEVKDGSGGVGSSGYIEFRGTVETLPASGLVGDWTVSGRTVHVTSSTQIREKHGPVRIGIPVEIEGNQRSDGSVDARKVGTED
jgi:hypothetical protein